MSGTGVGITPVSSITYKDYEIIPKIPEGKLSLEIRKILQDIQVNNE